MGRRMRDDDHPACSRYGDGSLSPSGPHVVSTTRRFGKLETSLHLFVALVVLAGIIGRSLPFALGLVGIWVLIVMCLRYVSRTRRGMALSPAHRSGHRQARRREPSLRYNLCLTGVLYLVPIGVGTAFYILLSAYIALFADHLSFEQLTALQDTLEAASEFFARHLKLDAVQVLVLLMATYVLSCLLLSVRPGRAGALDVRGKGMWLAVRVWMVTAVAQGVGIYTKLSGPIAVGLAWLAAFSFFGMQLGVPTHDLQLRLKTVQQGYAEVADEVDADMSEHVAVALYHRINSAMPASYATALTLETPIDKAADRTQERVAMVKSRYGLSDPVIDKALQGEAARKSVADSLSQDRRVGAEPGRGTHRDTPGSVSPAEVEAARRAVESRRHKAIELINESPREITLHVEEIGSERLVEVVTKLTAGYPILEPILQALAAVMDTGLQDRLGKLYDRALSTALRHPDRLEATVDGDATTLANQTDIAGAVARVKPLTDQRTAEIDLTLEILSDGVARLDQEVGAKFIGDLRSSEQATRDNATDKLIEFGPRLSRQQMDELMSIMRTGGESWQRSYVPPGGHCTIVETTPIKYYAAKVIERSGSPYVTGQVQDEAGHVTQAAVTRYKIDAPGWICFYPGIP